MVLLGEEGPEYELSGNALAATYASTGAALAARQTLPYAASINGILIRPA